MSRRIHLITAIAVCALLAPGAIFGQAAGGLRIGVVDFNRLIKESPQAKTMQKALEDEFAPRRRDLAAKASELKDRRAKLEKDVQVMGADERRAAESRYRDDERDLGRRQSEYEEDVNVRGNAELGKLQEAVLREIAAFAKQKGYDLIVGPGVLYAAQSVDLTSQILVSLEANAKGPVPAASKP
jgi:outer membrane protein